MAVTWSWIGATTDTSITGTAKLSEAESTGVRLAVATASDMSGTKVYSTSGNSATDGLSQVRVPQHTVSGLTARTHYWCQWEIDSSLTGVIGEFWTLPDPGTPAGFTFVHVSCNDSALDITANDAKGIHQSVGAGMF